MQFQIAKLLSSVKDCKTVIKKNVIWSLHVLNFLSQHSHLTIRKRKKSALKIKEARKETIANFYAKPYSLLLTNYQPFQSEPKKVLLYCSHYSQYSTMKQPHKFKS